ncbi:MAG: hypothetical protein AAGU27_05095 [Dehalobacterium sp.]
MKTAQYTELAGARKKNLEVIDFFNIIIGIILFLAIIGSIAAWINTKIILEELDLIKKHLGIKEDKNESFLADNKE